jgi:predicted metal-binding membrane protein
MGLLPNSALQPSGSYCDPGQRTDWPQLSGSVPFAEASSAITEDSRFSRDLKTLFPESRLLKLPSDAMWQARSDRRIFLPVFITIIVMCWLALFLWGLSPAGYLLNHETLAHKVVRLDGEYAFTALFFTISWTLMTIAMMLPTTLPLLDIFRGVTRMRDDRSTLLLILIAGYLTIWAGFGLFTHLVDFFIHRAVNSDAWLHSHTWLLVALPLITAGIYQFTPLKHLCLDKCRSPFSFVAQHWRGSSARWTSFVLGLRHGVFCLGCCWALMLLMFAVSVGNLVWMLMLAAVMGVEKNATWGRRISSPLGILLLTAGLTIVVQQALLQYS